MIGLQERNTAVAQMFTIKEDSLREDSQLMAADLAEFLAAAEGSREAHKAAHEVVANACFILDGPPSFPRVFASPSYVSTCVYGEENDDITVIASLRLDAQIGATVALHEFRTALGDDPTPREACAYVAAKLNASAEKLAELLATPN